MCNAALLRRRIRDNRFSMEMYTVGERSRTDVAVCYIDDKVDKKLLQRIENLISSIEVEALTMNIESLANVCLRENGLIRFLSINIQKDQIPLQQHFLMEI